MMGFVGHKALYEIASAVNSTLEVRGVLQSIVESVTKAVGAKGCAVLLLTAERGQLTHSADYGLSREYVQKGPVQRTHILTEFADGKNVSMVDVSADARVEYREEAIREGIVSMLSVPMMLGEELAGVLRIYASESRSHSAEEIDFLRAAANLGALALDRAGTHEAIAKANELLIQEAQELARLEVSREYLHGRLREVARELFKLEEGRKDLLRLVYVAGHDLKAPLAAVQAYMGVVLEGYAGEIPDKVLKILKRSSTRVMQMIELISNIMDLSRLEAGQLMDELKETDMESVIKNSLEVVAVEAQQKEIALKKELPQPLPNVRGDELRLQQVLTNLLVNAVTYTPSGGMVTLRVKEKPDEVLIEVLDTGIGIPPQDMSHLFDEFFRGSNVEVPGTGLGLAIVKRIVEAHGGRVWAESPCPETGQGSRFSFTLPRQGQAQGERQQ
ncbi:MAG: GAF domain-containing sensor histidine kinase [Chloroflexi bacterium]|nr:GAF domain-containing sensor histidine kinase [Chloroflexota bacterium]